ncbi:MAG: GntR family transcriptional regulator [Thermodesulfobacteriota bacterium]
MVIKPIQSSRIQDSVYEQLLQTILSGRILPGETVTLEGLAKLMNVSIMPVRVAFQKLQASGFVQMGKNRRIRIAELSPENLLEIHQIREMLEVHAAEKACKMRSEESLTRLQALYHRCVKAEDEEAYLQANREFHMTIYSEAGMPILLEVIESLWNRFSPYLHILLRNEQDFKAGDFNTSHRGMLEAMQRKNSKAVRQWLIKDLKTAADLIKKRLESSTRR